MAPSVADGIAGLVPRPCSAVGRAGRRRRRRGAAACVRSPRACSLRYDDTAAGVDEQQECEALYGPLDGGLDLDTEIEVDFDDRDFRSEPPCRRASTCCPARRSARSRSSRRARTDVQRRLVDAAARWSCYRNRTLKLSSRPGESQEDFLRSAATRRLRSGRRCETAKIRDRLEAKQDRLEAALADAQRRVEELDTDAKTRQANELIAGAGAVARRAARRAAAARARCAARSVGGSRAAAACRRARPRRKARRRRRRTRQDDLAELEQEILDEVTEIDERWREAAARSRRSRSGSRRRTCG